MSFLTLPSFHRNIKPDPDVNLCIIAKAGGATPAYSIWESRSETADAQCFMGFTCTHTHRALWIGKCSYSINAPFENLLQQHSSLYCNYTYCISLYSDPWGIYIVLAKARGTEGKQSFNDSAVLGSMI